MPLSRPGLQWLLAGLLILLSATGCASRNKIDWSTRIGSYTYDEAVLELGPPERHAELTDGSVVAEWLTARGIRYVTYPPPLFVGYYGRYNPYFDYPWPSTLAEPPSPDHFLRLSFGPDHKLTAWRNVVR